MAVIIADQQQIEDYFESSDINQSTLKDLAGGLDGFLASLAKKRKDKEENKPTPEYFLIGGAVDTILTGEEGEFERQYYVSTLEKKPSEVEISIIDSVFTELIHNDVDINTIEFSDCADAIIAAADEFNWQSRWKTETRYSKLVIAGQDYFEDLKRSVGMKILTSEMKNKIDTIVASLKNNIRTKKYFDRTEQSEQENIDFYYQLPIYFKYKGLDCKALMDLCVVYKDSQGNVTKIEPIDLKTMSGNTLQFIGKVKQHRYDIQAAWYVKALTEYFNCTPKVIEPFKFIVESTTNIGSPLVYKISTGTLIHGRIGSPKGTFISDDGLRQLNYPEVKGYQQLIEDYIYYDKIDFKEDKILENRGIIEIDWNIGII